MNRRGQLVLVNLMIAFILVVAVVIMIEPLKDQVSFARNSDNLDCGNSSISTEEQMTCIGTGFTLPAFVLMALAVAFSFIGARRLFGGGGE